MQQVDRMPMYILVPVASCMPAMQLPAASFCLEQCITCLLRVYRSEGCWMLLGRRLQQQCLRFVALSTCSPRPDSLGGL